MNKQLAGTIDSISLWVAAVVVFLTPLFFLPITTEFYEYQKYTLLVLSTLGLLLLWLIREIANKRIRIVISPLFVVSFLFALSFGISLIVTSTNKFEPLTTPGATGSMLTLFVFSFVLVNLFYQHKNRQVLLYALTASATVLSLIHLVTFAGIWKSLPVPEYVKIPSFTPAGSLLALAATLFVVLVWIGTQLTQLLGLEDDDESERDIFEQLTEAWNSAMHKASHPAGGKKNIDIVQIALLGLSFILILGGLGASVYQLTSTIKPSFLPPQFGWQIAVEVLKDPKTAFFGVGPTDFLSAFTRFRPINYNNSDLWATRFTTSSNFYFHYLTVVGALGLISYLAILFKVNRLQKKTSADKPMSSLIYAIYAIFGLSLIIPPNLLLSFLLFFFIALLSLEVTPLYIAEETTVITTSIVGVIALVLSGVVLYYGSRAYQAEMLFRKSFLSLGQNRGIDVYNQQLASINLNPVYDLYHATFAQTNLALATSISQRALATGSGQLSDNERQTVTNLIQQSIQEGKIAVTLNPQRVTNWENLGQIYRSLINIAQGADVWSVQVYQQATALDPANPQLRLALGGIYYALGSFDDAAYQFQLAATLKPNHANSYYNLGAAYREKKDYVRAYQAMQAALANLPANTPDRDRVTKELEDLRTKLPKQERQESATPSAAPPLISPPAPAPTGLKPPITLPTESAAPEITVQPTYQPTKTPTPIP